MPFDTLHALLRTSTKFMFVREPFERLLSGYVDKLFSPNAAYWNFIGKFIVSKFRKNATSHSLECGHDVTFEEFLKYYIYSQTMNEKRDAHFVPNFEHCRPCELDYDYIGKMETFEEDTFFILKRFNLDHLVKFENFTRETEIDALKDAADYVYSMKQSIERCVTLPEALLRAYRKLQIRGIISVDVQFPIPLEKYGDIPYQVFKRALLYAHSKSGPRAQRITNRKDSFIEAYKTVSPLVLNKVRESFFVDAQLFQYNLFPDIQGAKQERDFRFFSFK